MASDTWHIGGIETVGITADGRVEINADIPGRIPRAAVLSDHSENFIVKG